MNTWADLFVTVNPTLLLGYCLFLGSVCGWFVCKTVNHPTFKFSNAAWPILDDLFEPKLDCLWMITVVGIISAVSYYTNASVVEFASSVTGIVGAVLVAKGKSSSYFWGFIATALYTWISYKFKLYGETITYAFLFLPMQVIGYYLWMKNSSNENYDVIKKVMSTKQRIVLFIGTGLAIAAYAEFLNLLNGSMPGLDSATAILSIVATTLMIMRYAEQWLIWMCVNIVAVTMWIQAASKHDDAGWATLAMWVTFLLNCVYGWYKWRKGGSLENIKES